MNHWGSARRNALLAVVLAASYLLGPSVETASSQELPRGVSVYQRPRPDYDPLGLHLGGFFAYPSLEVGEYYESNIFATENGRKSDFVTVVQPNININSNWGEHELDFSAGAAANFFADHTTENTVDGHVGLNGRLDVYNDTYLTGSGSWQHLHESRGDPNSPADSKNPVEYNLYTGTVGVYHGVRKLSFRLDGNIARYDYINGEAIGGGTVINDDFNRTEYNVLGKVGYELSPNYQAFIRIGGNHINYDRADISDGINHTSSGFTVAGGVALDLTGVTTGEFYAGYLSQFYDSHELQTTNGFLFGGSLLWNVTPLTSIRAIAQRSVQQTTFENASSYLASGGQLILEHELLRNLLVGGEVSFENDNYQGIHRNDNIVTTGINSKYLINRHFYLNFSYAFSDRNSNTSGNSYQDNLVMIRLGTQL